MDFDWKDYEGESLDSLKKYLVIGKVNGIGDDVITVVECKYCDFHHIDWHEPLSQLEIEIKKYIEI